MLKAHKCLCREGSNRLYVQGQVRRRQIHEIVGRLGMIPEILYDRLLFQKPVIQSACAD